MGFCQPDAVSRVDDRALSLADAADDLCRRLAAHRSGQNLALLPCSRLVLGDAVGLPGLLILPAGASGLIICRVKARKVLRLNHGRLYI